MAKEKGGGLTSRQRMAAELLGCGKPQGEVARAVGVNGRTIFSWQRMPAFRAAREAATQAFLTEMRPRALEVMCRQMESGDEKLSQQAAGQILKLGEGRDLDAVMHVRFAGMPEPGEAKDEQRELPCD